MTPPVQTPPNSRPSKISRKFNGNDSQTNRPSYTEPDDLSTPRRKTFRSTTYTSPLTFVREEETAQRSASKRTFHLTKENLQNLQAVHEAEYSLQGRSLNDFHRPTRTINSRSPEKKTRSGYRRGEDLYDHSHILPSGGLKKSSTGMAKEEKSSSVQLDADANGVNGVNGDMETQPGSGDSATTQPSSPSTDDAPGAFPTESNENGTADEGMRSPTPPPHKISPKVDPEACKAAGNKF